MSSIYDMGGTSCDCFSINGKVNILQGDENPKTTQGQNGDVYFQSVGTIWSKRNDVWQKVESSMADWGKPTKNDQFVVVSPTEEGFDVKYYDSFTADDLEDVAYKAKNNTFTGVNTFTQVIQGTAYRAYWADLAEYYLTDKEYPKGTLVQFGGEKEMTIASTDVNAVITSEPGFILNSEINGQAIALIGRVPVRVKGKINKFDYIKLSDENGIGIRAENKDEKIIGRALESKSSENEGLVLCSVKIQL